MECHDRKRPTAETGCGAKQGTIERHNGIHIEVVKQVN